MGVIVAICTSPIRGGPKEGRPEARLIAGHGVEGDGHAGDWHRQVSILPLEEVEAFRRAGAEVRYGDFGENLVVEGISFSGARVGDRLRCGGALLEMTQFGKECHRRCRIYDTTGDCIMPRHGVFARVLVGGEVRVGDGAGWVDASEG